MPVYSYWLSNHELSTMKGKLRTASDEMKEGEIKLKRRS
jgi:hypothetical protein